MIEPCCDVEIKHSRYNVKERTEQKRPCCSKIFEKFKSSKTTKDYNDVLKEIDNGKEIITNLNIKTGKIRLPEIITKTTGFKDDDEVTISIDKGKLIVKKIND